MKFFAAVRGMAAVALLSPLGAWATADPDDLLATNKLPSFNRVMHDFTLSGGAECTGISDPVLECAIRAVETRRGACFSILLVSRPLRLT